MRRGDVPTAALEVHRVFRVAAESSPSGNGVGYPGRCAGLAWAASWAILGPWQGVSGSSRSVDAGLGLPMTIPVGTLQKRPGNTKKCSPVVQGKTRRPAMREQETDGACISPGRGREDAHGCCLLGIVFGVAARGHSSPHSTQGQPAHPSRTHEAMSFIENVHRSIRSMGPSPASRVTSRKSPSSAKRRTPVSRQPSVSST